MEPIEIEGKKYVVKASLIQDHSYTVGPASDHAENIIGQTTEPFILALSDIYFFTDADPYLQFIIDTDIQSFPRYVNTDLVHQFQVLLAKNAFVHIPLEPQFYWCKPTGKISMFWRNTHPATTFTGYCYLRILALLPF